MSSLCLYTYKAFITDVYDGDTVTADIDLGMQIVLHDQKLRLLDIDAPEVRGATRNEGLISRDWLRDEVKGKVVIVHTKLDKTGKYGRLLATLYTEGNPKSVNDRMVTLGLARYRTY